MYEYQDLLKEFQSSNIADLEKIAKHGDLKSFRALCHYAHLVYDEDYPTALSYAHFLDLVRYLNERVNGILGQACARLYDILASFQKQEFTNGDERYKLYSYDLASPFDRRIVLSLVDLKANYIGNYLDPDNMEQIINLCTFGRNDNFYKSFFECGSKKHVDLWVTLMDYIYEENYKAAYELIEEYDAA